MKAGIIGCGNIGTELALYLEKDSYFELIYLSDTDESQVKELQKKISSSRIKSVQKGQLIKNSDIIIESASKEAVREIISDENLDKKEKKILIMSTGGITQNMELFKKLKNCEIYVPSGAIAGLDAIKAAAGKITSLTLESTKPVAGLANAPYILKNNIRLDGLDGKKTIFEGSLKDAVEGFPNNINVAATLFLASGFEDIKIKIIADPNAKFNTHEIICKGIFGTITSKTENLPSKNPKTSYLAILSAVQVLKSIKNSVKIGA